VATDRLDSIDGRLIALVSANPRTGIQELATRLGVTRATVYARLERLEGVITGYGPDVDLGAIG
jgi:DNA-binding Lrp family transcriptional regulator